MTIEQLNDTDWLLINGDWQLVLSSEIQQYSDGKGGFVNEPTVLRDARVAMKNDFISDPIKLAKYIFYVQTDPQNAMILYCAENHPELNITAGIIASTAMTANPIEVLPNEVVAYKIKSIETGYRDTLGDIMTEVIPFETHKIECIKSVSVINPQGAEVVVDYLINHALKTVILNSNISLNNHTLIIT